jgi:hypothetical protein
MEAEGPPIVGVAEKETNHFEDCPKQLRFTITRIADKNFFITEVLVVMNS